MRRSLGLLSLLSACAPSPKDDTATGPADDTVPVDFVAPGPWHPARHTAEVVDPARDRALTVETWYPTDAAPAEADILDLLADPDQRATYAALLAAAPAGCPATTTTASVDASVAAGGPWPVIAMSHCHACTRFSTATVAEHLATYGFVVVAPDHAGNTLFDELAGTGLPLDTDTLALREADLAYALDSTLAGDHVPDLPVDPARVGLYGHSFGAVTAGILLQDRLAAGEVARAGLFVGAPPDNPLLPGVAAESLGAPVLFETLAEDHSIGSAGNVLVVANYEAVPGPAWHVDMADAGHWSPSELVGLTADFMPGCGEDSRDPGGEPFTYLPPVDGRTLSAAVAAAFFAATLNGDSAGADWLAAPPDGRLSVETR